MRFYVIIMTYCFILMRIFSQNYHLSHYYEPFWLLSLLFHTLVISFQRDEYLQPDFTQTCERLIVISMNLIKIKF